MKLALVISVALNLALAVVTVRGWGNHSQEPQKPVAGIQSPRPFEFQQFAPGSQLSPVTNAFNWSMIGSKDYEQYVANLRAVGCPEKTVRDIIAAEVQKTYAAKSAAVPSISGFWTSGPERAAAERIREARRSGLRAESRALLQRLIGMDFVPDQADDLLSWAVLRFVFGPLPDNAEDRVNLALEKGKTLSIEIQERSKGFLLPAEKDQLLRLHQQTLDSIQRFLSAEQFEELTRRFAMLRLDRQGFDDYHVSSAELRHISGLYISAFGVPLEDAFDSPRVDEEEADTSRKKLFQSKLQDFLGEPRYAEYQRDTDPDFKNVQSLAEQQTLPRETALKIYEVKSLFDSECRRLRENSLLSASDLAVQLQQVQNSTRSAIQELLNDRSYYSYLGKHGGNWMTNSLAP